jgi:hypothetical protein
MSNTSEPDERLRMEKLCGRENELPFSGRLFP